MTPMFPLYFTRHSVCRAAALLLLFLGMAVTISAQPYFPVRVNKQWGAIDSTGKVVLKPMYERVYVYGKHNEFLAAETGDSAFLLNPGLQIIARTAYSAIIEHGEGMFMTRLSSEDYSSTAYGLMDSTGKVWVKPKFSLMEPFHDGVAKANVGDDRNEKSGLIDKKGNWVIPPTYEPYALKSSSEGLVNFYVEGKGWGAMDVTGKIVIEPKYVRLGPCKYGYMEYGTGKHGWGLMKKDGTPVIPDDGKHAVSYSPHTTYDTLVTVHGMEFVQNYILPYRYTDTKIYSIDGKYRFDVPPGMSCTQQCNGFFMIEDGKHNRGMMDASGQILVKPQYNVLQWWQEGLIQVEKITKVGL